MRAIHRPLLGLALLAAIAAAHAAPVYQWKDANGVTHYSDKPPAGEQYQDRRIAPHGEPVPQGTQPTGKSEPSPQCTQARNNLDVLNRGGTVLQAGADGKPTGAALDATQLANQRALAEAAQKAYCN